MSFPEERQVIIQALTQIWQRHFSARKHLIAGMATAGIPHAAMLAWEAKAPMIYVRSTAKSHGKGQRVEGAYRRGDEVVIIEDLVNQGSSLASGVEALREEGLKPIGVLCLMNYQMPAAQKFLQRENIPLYSVLNFSDLVKYIEEEKKFTPQEVEDLRRWHASSIVNGVS